MSAGAIVALVLAAGAAAFILAPLFRNETAAESRRAATDSELLDLQSRHDMALAALKDLEDDRDTGKIGEIDYRELKTKLTAEAVEIMKQLDAHTQNHPSIASDRRAGGS